MWKVNQVLLNAVTINTTSSPVDVSNCTKIAIQVSATNISSGNGVFTVEFSLDGGTTWTQYNRLITNATGGTVVNSVTINSNTSNLVFLNLNDMFGQVRVKVVVTTDGKYTCSILAI